MKKFYLHNNIKTSDNNNNNIALLLVSTNEIENNFLVNELSKLMLILEKTEKNLSLLFETNRKELSNMYPPSIQTNLRESLTEMQDYIHAFYE